MKTVTVLELKAKAGELVRSVMRTEEEIQIIDNDEVVALLIPVKSVSKNYENAWAKLDNLAAEIGARWPMGVPSVDAMTEARR